MRKDAYTKEQWQEEKLYLQKVYQHILHTIRAKKENMDFKRARSIELQKEMSEVFGPAIIGESGAISPYLQQLKMVGTDYARTRKTLAKLLHMRKNPYFSRFDFLEKELETPEKIYMGLATLLDDKTGAIMVYDWRVPICSIFYRYELGNASYTCKDGVIEGEVKLKRQYKIEGKNLLYMFDCDLRVADEILQRLLTNASTDRMRNIVKSIQKEQDHIIRDETNQLLIVQGVAGSGKTSVALHRVAYFLYRFREEMDATSIALFSPNPLFQSYISGVLPELGEENVVSYTFLQIAQRLCKPYFEVETPYEQMEYMLLLTGLDEHRIRTQGITLKSTLVFMKYVQKYVTWIEQEYSNFAPIMHEARCLIPEKEARKVYMEQKDRPLLLRFAGVRKRLHYLIQLQRMALQEQMVQQLTDEGEKDRVNEKAFLQAFMAFAPARAQVEEQYHNDLHTLFLGLFDEKIWRQVMKKNPPADFQAICVMTKTAIAQGKLLYEDAVIFAYLRSLVDEIMQKKNIRHVVVDEAQDFSFMQFAVMHKLFENATYTILGDMKQKLLAGGLNDYHALAEIFQVSSCAMMQLTRCYRATRELVEFSRQLLDCPEEVNYLGRRGEKPTIITCNDEQEHINMIGKAINDMRQIGCKTVAVITKSNAQAMKAHAALIGAGIEITLLLPQTHDYAGGVVLLPAYLSKGLEFDAVLLWDVSDNQFVESESQLLYIMCTRALHRLHLYCMGQPSRCINKITSVFYNDNSVPCDELA